jgi:hypothetical protein
MGHARRIALTAREGGKRWIFIHNCSVGLTHSIIRTVFLTLCSIPRALTGSAQEVDESEEAEKASENSMQVGAHTGGLPVSGALPHRSSLPDDPVVPHNGFATYEEGEKAFFHLLKKAGVDANWTWEQTMRAIITDPLYKALNSLAEKKKAYEKARLSSRLLIKLSD